MKKLILVRHAQLDHSNHLKADFEFPLSKQGHRDAIDMAARFVELDIHPELILVSPAMRARETAEILAKKVGVSKKELVIKKGIYEAERGEVLHMVHELDDSFDTVMVVGHNPGMLSMIHQLVDHTIGKMPPGSIAVLDIDCDTWRQVNFGSSSLHKLMMPEEKVEDYTSWHKRFIFWHRQRIEKVELFVVFITVLVLILGLVAWGVSMSNKP